MPTYSYQCTNKECEKITNEIKSIANRGNCPVCECGSETIKIITAPKTAFVKRDLNYKCPVTGQNVTTHKQRTEIMARHNLYEAG